MLDFLRLEIYHKAKRFRHKVYPILKDHSLDFTVKDQLNRASLSVVLNVAEGAGRLSNREKRQFYVIARGSVFECAALIDLLRDNGEMIAIKSDKLLAELEIISRMLYGLIKSKT